MALKRIWAEGTPRLLPVVSLDTVLIFLPVLGTVLGSREIKTGQEAAKHRKRTEVERRGEHGRQHISLSVLSPQKKKQEMPWNCPSN